MAFEQLERKLKGVLSQQDLSDLIGSLERLAETAYLHGSSKAEAIQNATQKFPGALRALPELTGPSLKRDQDLLNSIANAKEEAYGLLAQSLLKGLTK